MTGNPVTGNPVTGNPETASPVFTVDELREYPDPVERRLLRAIWDTASDPVAFQRAMHAHRDYLHQRDAK